MKKFRAVLPIFLILIMLLTLASCDFSQNAEYTPREKASYYYENKNGELNEEKWILFTASKWKYYDGSMGTYEKTESKIVLQAEGEVWAEGYFSEGNFNLLKNGRIVTYYSVGNDIPQVTNVFTMQAVYEKAVDLGFEGTLEELIGMFRGENGMSAYELAVQRGYRGTEAEWLASLAGSEGKTPTIGENGHWYVGNTDTGVSATGTGISKIEKTSSSEEGSVYTIFMTDGTSYDFTVENGKDGAAAAKGTGIEKIEKTATDGEVDTYTISLTDGTSYDFTVTNGKNGTNGKDGTNGRDGKDVQAMTARDIYEEAVREGYEGSYLDFLGEYVKVADNEMAKINAACFSTVSILNIYQYNYMGGAILPGTSSGTGIIYQLDKEKGDAYILTNYHVVYVAERINENGETEPGIGDKLYVYLFGSEIIGNEFYTNVDYPGMYMEAEYIGGSMDYDIALLKITGSERLKNSNAKAVTFADSNQVSVGDTVYPVGNGGGDGIAVTKGIINYTSENLSITASDGKKEISIRVMRYDAAVNPGNSGGALFNSEGELIGVVNAKMIDSKYDNVGYAIPSVNAKSIVENILYYYNLTGSAPVEVKKLLFGISYTNSESYAVYDEETGKITRYDNMRVASVGETSLVVGQIEEGDIITKVKVERDGEETEYVLTRAYILADLTLTIRAGDKVTLTYKRVTDGVETEGEAVVIVTDNNLTVVQ